MYHHEIDYATWITAFATIGAVIAAVVASIKVYQLETARDAESKRLAKYAQAIQISGWITTISELDEYREKQIPHVPSVVAKVSNPSLQPIFNVVIMWRYKGHSLSTDHAHVIVPINGYHTFFIPSRHLARLRAEGYSLNSTIFKDLIVYPDIVKQFESTSGVVDTIATYEWYISAKISEKMTSQFQLLFSFNDCQGVRWQRDVNGILSESTIQPETALD
jgi:hypothetical protein